VATRLRDAVNFTHFDAARQQRVGNQRSVTSPGHGFRAHQCDLFLLRYFDALLEVLLEFRRLHVIRVAAEARISPAGIQRVFSRPAQTAEAGHVRVMDTHAFERQGQLRSAKLRIVARLRNLPDVDKALHAVRGQEIGELVDRTGRVADSEDRHNEPITRVSQTRVSPIAVG
jgi:hypothetical protein